MQVSQKQRDLLKKMAGQRKFVAELHKVMVLADCDFIERLNGLSEVAYTNERLLSRATKELLFIAISVSRGGDIEHVKMHMRAAVTAGATSEEILQVLELLALPLGMMAFRYGLDAWIDVFQPPKLELDSAQ